MWQFTHRAGQNLDKVLDIQYIQHMQYFSVPYTVLVLTAYLCHHNGFKMKQTVCDWSVDFQV